MKSMEIVTLTTVLMVVEIAGILKEDLARCALSKERDTIALMRTTLLVSIGPLEARVSRRLKGYLIPKTTITSSSVLELMETAKPCKALENVFA